MQNWIPDLYPFALLRQFGKALRGKGYRQLFRFGGLSLLQHCFGNASWPPAALLVDVNRNDLEAIVVHSAA